MKIFAAISLVAVIALAALIVGLGCANNDGSVPSPTQPRFNGSNGFLAPQAAPTPTPFGGRFLPGRSRPETTPVATPQAGSSGQSTPTLASGPYLVASSASDLTQPPTQQRVFRTPDGTVAILYHRPTGPKRDLTEIVMIHSHDGGQTWHGELSIGLETGKATYSGAMDASGSLYVVHGKDGQASTAGAIKFTTLFYESNSHGWKAGAEHRLVWDFAGKGATQPVLAMTGSRMWLAYRFYDGINYTLNVKYADPDGNGDYPSEKWSKAKALVTTLDSPLLFPLLVAHGSRLSAIFVEGQFLIRWIQLADPQGDPEGWTKTSTIIGTGEPGLNGPRFSALGDAQGALHLVFGVQAGYIGYMKYDGRAWSRARQLVSQEAHWPVLSTDGETVWVLWEKHRGEESSYIEVKKWDALDGWDPLATRPWSSDSEAPFKAVWVYGDEDSKFADVTRQALSPAKTSGDTTAGDIAFFKKPGDMVYLGQADKFDYVNFNLTQLAGGNLHAAWEYWDGSAWKTLAVDDEAVSDFGRASSTSLSFSHPQDWEPVEVNGYSGYYLRVRRDGSDDFTGPVAAQILPIRNIKGPNATVAPNGAVDVLFVEQLPGGAGTNLWYGSLSLEPNDVAELPPAHTHEAQAGRLAPAEGDSPAGVQLLQGANRQYISVEFDEGESFDYQLLDGQDRQIKLIETRLGFRGPTSITIWATATVEVSGPGLRTQRQEISAAYLQSPVILNGVRIYVEITKEFNDARLRDGGGTEKAARLTLSDARYSLTDVNLYRWPFPGRMWGLGPSSTYYQGLQGSLEAPNHHGAFDHSVPWGTPVHAWHSGTLDLAFRGFDWIAGLKNADDGESPTLHHILHLWDTPVEKNGTRVEIGDYLGYAIGDGPVPLVHWGTTQGFHWQYMLPEWYVAQSTPVERSFVKDWLVVGPFRNTDDNTRLAETYIPNEATVEPQDADLAAEGLRWRRLDAIVPGVVDVGEALSEFRNSRWSWLNGNEPFSVAYFATYVHTEAPQTVVLHIGSSDAVKVWVGDKVALEENTSVIVSNRGDWSIIPDAYSASVSLQPGWTRILLKLAQGETSFPPTKVPQKAWQISFRISDEEGNPVPDVITSPEKDPSANPLANYVITAPDVTRIPRAIPPNLPADVSYDAYPGATVTAAAPVRQAGLHVAADKDIYPFTPKLRGAAMNNWNWLWSNLLDDEDLRNGLAEVTGYFKPGIIRFGGGLWANSVGWDRNNIAPKDGAWTLADPATGQNYSYAHAYKPELIDRYAAWARSLGADTIMQVNICDDNPGMWADMLRYTNIEHDYKFKYWEIGNEQDLNRCVDVREYTARFAAYQTALKAVDPSIKVVGPSSGAQSGPTWFGALAAKMGKDLDTLSWHWFQLTEWSTNPDSFAYQVGSLDALSAHDGAVGTACHEGFGCPGQGSISRDRLNRLTYRRAMPEAIMRQIMDQFRITDPTLETAMTEFGVHASRNQDPINSNHIAAVWLADMLPRWAYNGLDIATYYSLEDGGSGQDNSSRGLAGVWDQTAIDIRPIYYTLFMYAQYFGDTLVESSTSDPDKKVVAWASRDTADPGALKLILVNLRNEKVSGHISIEGFTPALGYAYELTSTDPMSLEYPSSFTEHKTTINGYVIPDYEVLDPQKFRDAVMAITPNIMRDVSSKFSYELPPMSVVAIVLRDSIGEPPPSVTSTGPQSVASPGTNGNR